MVEFAEGSISCASIGKSESWLCQLVTGNGKWCCPLKRCRVFGDLEQRLIKTLPSESADKMLSLSWEDEPEESSSALIKKRQRAKPSVVTESIEFNRTVAEKLQMPLSPDDDRVSDVFCALHRKKLWIACRSIPWLVAYLGREKELGSLDPVPVSDPDTPRKQLIRWNFRDGNWQARAQSPSGKWYTHAKGIRNRQSKEGDQCYGLDFQEAKQVVYEELVLWISAVEAGDASEGREEVH